jgi:hypothetical protein
VAATRLLAIRFISASAFSPLAVVLRALFFSECALRSCIIEAMPVVHF